MYIIHPPNTMTMICSMGELAMAAKALRAVQLPKLVYVRYPLVSPPNSLATNPLYQYVPQSDTTTPYTSFKPSIPSLTPVQLPSPGPPTTTLDHPAEAYFDEILLSALAIERQRLIPGRSISDPVKFSNFYKEF
jgi:hypothetical protein